MSSFAVRQLVAMVGFGGVAVLVGMPVRAQQVVLTPAGMQMVPIAPPVQAQNNMTMEELLKNSPRMEGVENLPDFWTKPGAPIVSPPSDYVQSVEPISSVDASSNVIYSVKIDNPNTAKIGSTNYSRADLKNNDVPAPSMTLEEIARSGLVPTLSQNLSTPVTQNLSTPVTSKSVSALGDANVIYNSRIDSPTNVEISLNRVATPDLKNNNFSSPSITSEEIVRSGLLPVLDRNLSTSPISKLVNYQVPVYSGQTIDRSVNDSSLTNSRVFPWSVY
jgi:hypothetical protein